MTFYQRLKAAAQDAILLGVKWAIVAALIGVGAQFVIRDYLAVRAAASQGAAAFDYLNKAVAAQQKAAAPEAGK